MAWCVLQENTTKRIVDNPVAEGLTEYVEVVKLTSHERVQRLFDVDHLVPQEVAKEIREVIMDIEIAREETLQLTKTAKRKQQPKKKTPTLLKFSKEGCAGSTTCRCGGDRRLSPRVAKLVCGWQETGPEDYKSV